MISAGVEKLTGLDGTNMVLRSIILLTITVIFAISSYTGLKKGIQKLSDVNVWLSICTFSLCIYRRANSVYYGNNCDRLW